jgi:hypothetical protein
MDYLPPRSAAGTKKIMEGHRKGRTKPSNLREQVDPETMRMYPTPTTQEVEHPNMKLNEKGRRLTKDGKDSHSLNLADTMRMYPTPTQDSASERTKKYKQGGTPLPVAVKMYPTPTVVCEEGGEQSHLVERTKSGGFVSRRKGSGITYGSKLSDAMLYLEKMYPTPSTRDYKGGSGTIKEKDGKYYRQSNTTGTKYGVRLDALMEYKNKKPGGKLNPTFVEFLMGFPMNWTKTEPTESKPLETQSSHKLQESLD